MTSSATVDTSPCILFVVYGSGHIGKVAPVIKYLQAQGISCELLALTLGYKQAERLGLAPKGYRDFMHLVDAKLALDYGRAIAEGNYHPDVDAYESLCYLGVNYLEWVEEFGAQEAAKKYQEGGRRSFSPVNFLARVIADVSPSVVVSTGSPRSEQAAVEAAVLSGVPCLTMVDLFALPHESYVRYKVFADRITVLSDFVKNNLVSAGINASRIAVTGCPAYEPLFDISNQTAATALRTSLGWGGLQVLMWAGNLEEPGEGVTEQFQGAGLALDVERRLRAWVASRPDVALLIRYHPSQYHLFPDLGTQDRVYRSNPVQDALVPQLHLSDIVVVQGSTVGFEAALIGKRVLCLSYSPMVINMNFDYAKLGLGESVSSPEDLLRVLDGVPCGVTNRNAFPPAGSATARVAAEIKHLIRQQDVHPHAMTEINL